MQDVLFLVFHLFELIFGAGTCQTYPIMSSFSKNLIIHFTKKGLLYTEGNPLKKNYTRTNTFK